jgi:hypothetical protein
MAQGAIDLKMLGILSNYIDAVGWENGIFEIWLKNGIGYRYYGVTEEQYHSVFADSDFGRNYNALKRVLPAPEKFVLPPRR